MASASWQPRNLIYNINHSYLHPEVLSGRSVSIHYALRPDLKVNITAPTGPNLLPVLFTQKNSIHNKK
jgi:hypothetical protein